MAYRRVGLHHEANVISLWVNFKVKPAESSSRICDQPLVHFNDGPHSYHLQRPMNGIVCSVYTERHQLRTTGAVLSDALCYCDGPTWSSRMGGAL
jgi:hypothetical protein